MQIAAISIVGGTSRQSDMPDYFDMRALPSVCAHVASHDRQVRTSNAFMLGMLGILAACTFALGPLAMFNLYFVPYWVNVVWLDVVTYLHHHGSQDADEKIPWYRGEVCSCLIGAPGLRRTVYGAHGFCVCQGAYQGPISGQDAAIICACPGPQ